MKTFQKLISSFDELLEWINKKDVENVNIIKTYNSAIFIEFDIVDRCGYCGAEL